MRDELVEGKVALVTGQRYGYALTRLLLSLGRPSLYPNVA